MRPSTWKRLVEEDYQRKLEAHLMGLSPVGLHRRLRERPKYARHRDYPNSPLGKFGDRFKVHVVLRRPSPQHKWRWTAVNARRFRPKGWFGYALSVYRDGPVVIAFCERTGATLAVAETSPDLHTELNAWRAEHTLAQTLEACQKIITDSGVGPRPLKI